MDDVNRRSALALGIAASSAVVMTGHAAAQPIWPVQGREIAPGVRIVQHGKGDSMIPGYTRAYRCTTSCISRRPHFRSFSQTTGSAIAPTAQSNGHQFTAKAGDVWSCNKGLGESVE